MALTSKECLKFLESLRWKGKPICPYCGSDKASALKNEQRHHCNYCSTSYSVTVNTIFHHSHVVLLKWFHAIYIVCSSHDKISVRYLANEIRVTKNTASSILKKIKSAAEKDKKYFEEIAYFYKKNALNRDK